jgi:surface antigen
MANGFAFDAWDGELASLRATADGRVADESLYSAELYAGERVGPPLPSRTLTALKRLIAISVVTVLAWGCWQTREAWKPWISSALEQISPNIPPPAPASAPTPEEPTAAASATVQPLAVRQDIPDVAGSATNPPGSPSAYPAGSASTSEEVLPPASSASNTTPELTSAVPPPLPPPVVDPQNKKQQRAAAIGLHPGVSHVLLSSMSDVDYRNAAQAIRTALAETADADKYVWPLKRSSRLAVFQVHFVQGAGPDCRRYIVTVIKNGWTTTAPPMEKCGIQKPKQSTASLPSQKRIPTPPLD